MSDPFLILGATGGVGMALAKRLAAAGRALVLAGRDRDRLEQIAAETGSPSIEIDILAAGASQRLKEAAGNRLGGLVYAVGSIVLKPLKSTTEADFLDAFRLNAVGAALAVKATEPALRASGGAVVLFSTVAVRKGFAGHAAVAAAKGAVEGLTHALAAELAPHVRVNAVAPSLMRTEMARSITQNEPMAKAVAALHPIPRLGEAEDAAAAAAFLLSPEAAWITGQVLGVDGGRSTLATKG